MIEGTFLAHFGYYIPVCNIKDKINEVINELTVYPRRMDATKDDIELSKFSLYRYSKDKQYIIVPRYYGTSKFGEPSQTTFNDAEKIETNFTQNLRPVQQVVADQCLDYMKKHGGGILSVPCGFGKCLAKGTLVLMFDGTLRRVETIKVGEKIMGDDSTPRVVLSTTFGIEKIYRMRDETTTERYDVNESHIVSLKDDRHNTIDLSVHDVYRSETYRKLKGYRTGVNWNFTRSINNDPFEFGKMLSRANQETPCDMYKLLSEIDNYIFNTQGTREQLLFGILGNANETGDTIINTKYQIYAHKLCFLVRSLGYYCNINYADNMFNVHIDKTRDIEYNFKLSYIGVGEYFGFEIDGNRRFVLGDFTVTHNTVCALYIAKMLGLKTLVVVHKTFLLNQWMDRAIEFLGLTRDDIGIIRQNKCEIEGKKLVVGIIHTLSKKTYYDTFNKFGFVIYDEAHHVTCKFFSKALMKSGAKYTLALTATPYRTDGLIRVMFWFCGEMIYCEKIKINKNVVAKILRYKSDDKNFVLKKKWSIGQLRPDTGKMITNLCSISTRNDIIVNIIDNIRKNQMGRKILVLSGRKFHLKYLKKQIDKRIKCDISKGLLGNNEFYTCFYTGDTKIQQRQEAEQKGDIIFATYDMAHEGLDIKHMNTVILASPKKDVVQSIGRIMRTILKVGDIRPLIIDIYDEIDCLRNWASKRILIYKQRKYTTEEYYLNDDKFVTSKVYYGDYIMDKVNNDDQINNIAKYIVYDENENNEFIRDIQNFCEICSKLEPRNNVQQVYRKYKNTHDMTNINDVLNVDQLTCHDFSEYEIDDESATVVAQKSSFFGKNINLFKVRDELLAQQKNIKISNDSYIQ